MGQPKTPATIPHSDRLGKEFRHRSVCATGQPACPQVGRWFGLSGSDREYLALLETDNATPYYLNLHEREGAHTLILGATGSGKSFLRKYAPRRLPPMQLPYRCLLSFTTEILAKAM